MESEEKPQPQKSPNSQKSNIKNYVLVAVIVFVLTAFGSYLIFDKGDTQITGLTSYGRNANNFTLIDPSLAELDLETFLERQKSLSVSYLPLKKEIVDILVSQKGEYSFYFEDLNTGAWIGINEKREFIPASLFKMPAVIAIVKKIEKGELSLDDTLTLTESDLDSELHSGDLYLKGAGYELTVREALKYVLEKSDNTALNALMKRFTYGEITEAHVATGLPWPKFTNKLEDNLVSPKQYMNVFRSLYYSSYLRRTYSQLILSMLSEADFDSAIPSGVPKNIKVANKVGFFNIEPKSYHDCGIVYYTEHPYMICVMSSYTTQEEFNSVASEVSEKVYEYISKK